MNTYEGLFLLDGVEAKRDWEGTVGQVREILTKHGAEMGTYYRWDERKLAYEVNRHKRGTYLLAYFTAPVEAIVPIRRDCGINEVILRQLILRYEGEVPATPTDEQLSEHYAALAAASQPGRMRRS